MPKMLGSEVSCLLHVESAKKFNMFRSLDLGPRSQRLGWNKPLAEPDEPL
jgi:hypothetical protein